MKTKILYCIFGALVIATLTFVETYGFMSLINDNAPTNDIVVAMAGSLTCNWAAITFIAILFSHYNNKLQNEIDELKKQIK